MDSLDVIRRLHQHRDWTNQQILATASTLTDKQLHQPFEIGQGSIWRTLTHLYAGEYIWLEALIGNEDPLAPGDAPGQLPGNQAGKDAATSLPELSARWNELNQRWHDYLNELSVDSLDDLVCKKSSIEGKRSRTRRSDTLLHVCTHAHYTVAQAINMMRHVGVHPLPDPMLITLARRESVE